MTTALLSPTIAKFEHARAGRPIWLSGIGEVEGISDKELAIVRELQPWNHNYLADEGESLMLDSFFRAASLTTNFYLTLLTADPGETGTMATMSEVTGTGMARITMIRGNTDFPTLALASGDFQVTALAKVFTAGGTWTAATHAALVTTVSGTAGKLLVVNALSATRTLLNTDTLTVTLAVKQQ